MTNSALWKIAMEMVSLPIENGDLTHSHVNICQRVDRHMTFVIYFQHMYTCIRYTYIDYIYVQNKCGPSVFVMQLFCIHIICV